MARQSEITTNTNKGLIGFLKTNNIIWLWVATAVLLAISGFISPQYVQPDNLLRLLRQAVPFGFIAIGQTLAMLTGHVDLSVQSITVFAGMLGSSYMMGSDANLVTAFLLVAGMAATFGLMNGLGITKLGINPFVMTLGTGIMLDGLTMVFTGGATRGTASPILKFIGTGRLFDFFPVSIIVWIIATIIVVIV